MITASTPALAAAAASSTLPTWIRTFVPARCAGSINGDGSPQKSTRTGTRSARTAAICFRRSSRTSSPQCGLAKAAMIRFPPKGRFVSSRVRSTRLLISSIGKPRPRTPSPPAFETAAASSGTADAAKPTCRMGGPIPSRSQSGVRTLTAGSVPRRGIRRQSPSLLSEMFERLADEDFAYLTTIGRRSGKQHTIEVWFALHDGRIYMLSGGGDRADWVKKFETDAAGSRSNRHAVRERQRAHPSNRNKRGRAGASAPRRQVPGLARGKAAFELGEERASRRDRAFLDQRRSGQ